MDQQLDLTPATMRLFAHHLYEYKKGVRQLIMMTMGVREATPITRRLDAKLIDYYVHPVTATKVNMFFGRSAWVETTRSVVTKPLNQLSAEEDFILGTLLGYDKEEQCRRFLAMAKSGRCAGCDAVA